MKSKFKIIEIIKPLGETIFQTTKLMFVPGKGIINLHNQQTIDYDYLEKNNDYLSGVVLPVSEFTNNRQSMGKLESCKGIFVQSNRESSQIFKEFKNTFEGHDAIIDFIYIAIESNIENDESVVNAVKLGLLFQSIGKFVVFSIKIQDNKSVKSLQKALSDLTYHVNFQNLFIQGLLIQIQLLDISNQKQRVLVEKTILKRCLPAVVKNIGIRVSNQKDLETIFSLNSQKSFKLQISFSIKNTSIDPYLLTMSSAGIFK